MEKENEVTMHRAVIKALLKNKNSKNNFGGFNSLRNRGFLACRKSKGFSSTKGQEEIVGFILVVLVIIVLGIVFLFMMKPKAAEEKDFQTENLLYSMIGTTVQGKTIGERIESCEKEEGCDILRQSLNNLTNIAFSKVGYSLGKNIKGYNLTISEGMAYSYAKGNATQRSIAAATAVRNSVIKLKFYY